MGLLGCRVEAPASAERRAFLRAIGGPASGSNLPFLRHLERRVIHLAVEAPAGGSNRALVRWYERRAFTRPETLVRQPDQATAEARSRARIQLLRRWLVRVRDHGGLETRFEGRNRLLVRPLVRRPDQQHDRVATR